MARRGRFRGRIVHPQFWPDGLDFAGKSVAVIGSGATAVTLVPALAETAAQSDDGPALAELHRRARRANGRHGSSWLPPRACVRVGRISCSAISSSTRARKRPRRSPNSSRSKAREALPRLRSSAISARAYTPWDQRLCLDPRRRPFRGDLRRQGRRSRPAEIDRFRAGGPRARSRARRSPPISSSPRPASSCACSAASSSRSTASRSTSPSTFNYKGMMLSGVPNLALSFGYTNASWTLKAISPRAGLPPDQPHGSPWSPERNADHAGRHPPQAPCSVSHPATSAAPPPSCRARATERPGRSRSIISGPRRP